MLISGRISKARSIQITATLAILIAAFSSSAFAADPFYFGAWKITSAAIAPWWDDRAHPPDPSETKELVGKSVTFEAQRILGPRALNCPKLKYKVANYPADWLFQGSFGEMHLRDKSVDPAKIAASVGFSKGKSWKTVETGCGNEIDYHFIDESTAAIGLNNYIYILNKLQASGTPER